MKNSAITCIQCRRSFFVSPDEQQRIMARGFGLPTRCPSCRKHKLKTAANNQKWKDKGRVKHGWRIGEYDSVAR